MVRSRLLAHRNDCEQLRQTLCQRFGEGDVCNMVRQRIQTLPVGHCAQALSHIDDVVAELQGWKTLSQPMEQAPWAALVARDAPSVGPDDARVVLVEFSDFQCPFCAGVVPALHAVLERYPKDVRVVFRQFPLSFHANARTAARAALVAHDLGRFWGYHQRLFAHQAQLGSEDLVEHAAAVGLDRDAFRKALADPKYESRVVHDLALGDTASVNGTPTVFVNGLRMTNPTDPAELLKAVASALEK